MNVRQINGVVLAVALITLTVDIVIIIAVLSFFGLR